MFQNIPLELRTYNQWVVWRFEEPEGRQKPTKVPYCVRTGRLAKTNDPDTWCSFDKALSCFKETSWYNGIGFVLTEADPFLFIDLDDSKDNKEVLKTQLNIFNTFESYSEKSPSGSGLHIIIKGRIPSGRKRSDVEIYSSGRFMTMTGDVYKDLSIKDYTPQAMALWEQMGRGKNAVAFYAGLEKAKLTDQEVLDLAGSAQNSEKFNDLFIDGDWQKYYPSQSEADFALIDIIAFYSQNAAQTQRIFLESKLGQREKSKAQYRINYMLNRCFDNMLPPVDIEGLKNKINEIIESKKEKPPEIEITESFLPQLKNELYNTPPGLVGELAKFIYAQAVRPVPEVALVGAIGLMAGIVGRAYNISGTGLNQYILLLAPTGTGKESIASGIDKLMNLVLKSVPASVDFVGPGEIASSQALIKYMSKTANSFVSITGEFGLYLQQMGSLNAPTHLLGLRRMLLDLYNKSGEGKVLRPSIYSDKEKNTQAVLSPAFTLLGESTPEKFYEGLHEGMISEGLLPRFTIIEYKGNRPELNENHTLAYPGFELIEKLSTLCAHALMLNSQHKAIHVELDHEVKAFFKQFDKKCDLEINSSEREVKRHLWNRAHIKALKLSGLVAVGCNPYEPTVTMEMAIWATDIILEDVKNILSKFNEGEVGIDNDENKQLTQCIRMMGVYLFSKWSDLEKYKAGNLKLHSEKIVPYSFLHKRLSQLGVFRNDKIGSSGAIKRALKILCERGDIQEISRSTLSKDYGTSALCFMACNMKLFE